MLTFNFEELSDSILGMVNTHVTVDNDLVLYIFALDGESNCGLIGYLMIPKSILVIILKL